jgi:hypothetical protein
MNGLYQQRRRDLDQWLSHNQPINGIPPTNDTLRRGIYEVMRQTRLVVTGINAVVPEAKVQDRNPYRAMPDWLDRALRFESFSLGAYPYKLPQAKRPGIRIALDEKDWRRRISVILYEDTMIWRVDEKGKKIQYNLLHLTFGDDGLTAKATQDSTMFLGDLTGWPELLTESLCLPLRLFLKE